jgi:hypothetical protein
VYSYIFRKNEDFLEFLHVFAQKVECKSGFLRNQTLFIDVKNYFCERRSEETLLCHYFPQFEDIFLFSSSDNMQKRVYNL